jgi:hypothetical protein
MTWIRKHLPSPATAIAIGALVVALGGAAFAAIPDSNGTIHGCYQKNNGNLRVVDAAGECKNSENALAWNEQGPPGSGVVARIRSVGSIALSGGSNTHPVTTPVPLTSNSWSQSVGEVQDIYGQIDLQTTCGDQAVAVLPFVTISIDGKVIEDVVAKNGLTDFRIARFEEDQSVTHTMTATVSARGCSSDPNPTLKSVKADVVGFR